MREWLKQVREEQGLSQKEVAEKVKISYPHYNFIENGTRNPSPQIAHRIAKVLGFADKWYKLLEPPESA